MAARRTAQLAARARRTRWLAAVQRDASPCCLCAPCACCANVVVWRRALTARGVAWRAHLPFAQRWLQRPPRPGGLVQRIPAQAPRAHLGGVRRPWPRRGRLPERRAIHPRTSSLRCWHHRPVCFGVWGGGGSRPKAAFRQTGPACMPLPVCVLCAGAGRGGKRGPHVVIIVRLFTWGRLLGKGKWGRTWGGDD